MKTLTVILSLALCLLSGPARAEKPAELNKMRFGFEVELAELLKPLADLNAKYRKHLEKQKAAFQQAGNLEAVLAVDAEMKIFEADLSKEFSSIPELKRLQGIYREQKRKVNNELIGKKLSLIQSYSEKARELSVQWTKEGKLDDARLALDESKRISAMASDPSLMAAIPGATTEKPTTPATNPSQPSGTLGVSASPEKATKESPFINSLGMRFIPVPIRGGPSNRELVLFSVWETRGQDYEAFLKEKPEHSWPKADFQEENHPAVKVNWTGAVAFCEWLTEKEQEQGLISVDQRYRLPTDHEWSCAVGIGKDEEAEAPPLTKDNKIPNIYPWGSDWPPPKEAGNFYGEETMSNSVPREPDRKVIEGFDDGFDRTAPVGSFKPNKLGLYDLGGNAWEWCQEWRSEKKQDRVRRGASWGNAAEISLRSSRRGQSPPKNSNDDGGFRCVLAQ